MIFRKGRFVFFKAAFFINPEIYTIEKSDIIFFIKNASAGSVGQSRISSELLRHIRNLKDRFRLRFSKLYRISSDRAEYFNGVNFRPLR